MSHRAAAAALLAVALVAPCAAFSAPALVKPQGRIVGAVVSPALAPPRPKATRSAVIGLKALDIPATYGAVMSTAAFSAGMVQWAGTVPALVCACACVPGSPWRRITTPCVRAAAIKVAIARKQYGIKYPKMYEGTEDSVFDCVQRAHQNTLEYLPSFLALLMLNGLAAPLSTAAVGMVWNVARIAYVIGYGKGDPNGRLPGAAISGLAFLGLVLATFANGVLLSGLLSGASAP